MSKINAELLSSYWPITLSLLSGDLTVIEQQLAESGSLQDPDLLAYK